MMKATRTHSKIKPAGDLREQLEGLLPHLRRFARGLARDPEQADDLVQDACERAIERLEQVRAGTRLDSWMYRIIYTRWIDRMRRRKSRVTHLRLLAEEGRQAEGAGRVDNRLEAALDVKSALAALSEEHRAAILLVAVEGYSYSEAADVLDLPVGTVASRVARARSLLTALLAQGARRAAARQQWNSGKGGSSHDQAV